MQYEIVAGDCLVNKLLICLQPSAIADGRPAQLEVAHVGLPGIQVSLGHALNNLSVLNGIVEHRYCRYRSRQVKLRRFLPHRRGVLRHKLLIKRVGYPLGFLELQEYKVSFFFLNRGHVLLRKLLKDARQRCQARAEALSISLGLLVASQKARRQAEMVLVRTLLMFFENAKYNFNKFFTELISGHSLTSLALLVLFNHQVTI